MNQLILEDSKAKLAVDTDFKKSTITIRIGNYYAHEICLNEDDVHALISHLENQLKEIAKHG